MCDETKSRLIAGYVHLNRRRNFLLTSFLLFKFVTSETIGSFGFFRLAHFKTLFTWSGGPRSSGVSFFCFVSPRA